MHAGRRRRRLQHLDVREWVEHYAKLGATRVYLVDHGSDPPLFDAVADYVDSGLLDYRFMTNDMMRPVYKTSLRSLE